MTRQPKHIETLLTEYINEYMHRCRLTVKTD